MYKLSIPIWSRLLRILPPETRGKVRLANLLLRADKPNAMIPTQWGTFQVPSL